jgi:hypothetical protein
MRATNPLRIRRSKSKRALLTTILLFAISLFASSLSATAQQPATPPAPATAPAQSSSKTTKAHRKPSGAHSAPAPAVPTPPVAPEQPKPDWPVNDRPSDATVVWNSQGLRIEAANSSLQQILKDVGTLTGTRIQGLGADQRIFGTYGPGSARVVLSELLDGSGYNVLMIGEQGEGTPRQVILSSQATGQAPKSVAANQNSQADEDADAQDQAQPQPQPEPPPQPPVRNGLAPGAPPRTPQQILQEMQQRQQQMQQQANPQP